MRKAEKVVCPLPPAPHPAAHTVFGGREHEVPDRLVPVGPLRDEAAVPEVPFPPPRCSPIPGCPKMAGDSVLWPSNRGLRSQRDPRTGAATMSSLFFD